MMLAIVVQFYKGVFLHFYKVLIINIEHSSSLLEFVVKFLDLNCIFIQDNVHYWDMFIIIQHVATF